MIGFDDHRHPVRRQALLALATEIDTLTGYQEVTTLTDGVGPA